MFLARRIVPRIFVTATVLAVALLSSERADAVILYKSSIRNKSAPTGTEANSGWQYEGNWAGGFTGTPIAANYFMSASHLGGGVGQNIFYENSNHLTTAMYDDPATDLVIYKVATPFKTWAPLYTGTSETGKLATVFGRGTGRGNAVTVNGQTKGWLWATQDKVRSWGDNKVAGFVNGGTGFGSLLKFTFDKNGTANEAALSTGDSGGGVFINDNGKWKLDGIAYLVEGPYSKTGKNGTGFNASLYDRGGLYLGGDNKWSFTADGSTDVPGAWYATRVSTRMSWINSILAQKGATASMTAGTLTAVSVPEPGSASLILIGVSSLILHRRRAR